MRARSFQTPALPAKPSLRRRVDNVGAIVCEESVTYSDTVRTVVTNPRSDFTKYRVYGIGYIDDAMVQEGRGCT